MNWTPIRKLAAAGITAAVIYAAQRLGLDIGSDDVNDAAQAILPVLVGYAVKDPRVKAVADDLSHSALAGEVEKIVLAKLAERGIRA